MSSVPVTIFNNRRALDKPLEVAADNILTRSMPYLAWDVQPPPPPPVAGVAAQPLAPRTLPQWAAIDAFLSVCSFDLTANNPAHWRVIHCLKFALQAATWTRILSALVDSGLGAQALTEETHVTRP